MHVAPPHLLVEYVCTKRHVLLTLPYPPVPLSYLCNAFTIRAVRQTELGEGLHLPQGQVLGGGQHRREGVPQN